MTVASSSFVAQTWNWRHYQETYRIHAVKAGDRRSDRPPILFIHGFGASTVHWKKNMVSLQAETEVWAMDLLGFGRSEKAIAPYSGQFWSQQIHGFIQDVIGAPVVLVGNSIGGYATLCTAADYPESVHSAVLLNSAGPFSGERSQSSLSINPLMRTLQHLRQDTFRQAWVHLLVFLSMRRRSTIRKTLSKVYFDASTITDELVEAIYQPAWERGAFGAFSAMFSSPSGEPIDTLLNRMHCPLLLLWGAKDPWSRTEARSLLFRRFYPELTEYFLEAGHCPHDEVPEQVNRLLKEWLTEDWLTAVPQA